MGKIRTKTFGLEAVEEKQKEKAKVRREQKKKREGKTKTPSAKAPAPKEESKKNTGRAVQEVKEEIKTPKKEKSPSVQKKQKTIRGKLYQKALKQTDKNKQYTLSEAIGLIKKIKYARFDETVELHLNVKNQHNKGEITFPHAGFGKKRRVAIIDDAVLLSIEKGKIPWDVLIAHPSMMTKLVKYARLLGPKGLMPNPKNGTLTENTESALKKFSSAVMQYKTEAKFPLIHQSVGKLSFTDAQLMDNIEAFIKAVSPNKINTIFLKSTMSPSIRLQIE